METKIFPKPEPYACTLKCTVGTVCQCFFIVLHLLNLLALDISSAFEIKCFHRLKKQKIIYSMVVMHFSQFAWLKQLDRLSIFFAEFYAFYCQHGCSQQRAEACNTIAIQVGSGPFVNKLVLRYIVPWSRKIKNTHCQLGFRMLTCIQIQRGKSCTDSNFLYSELYATLVPRVKIVKITNPELQQTEGGLQLEYEKQACWL